MTTPIYYQLLWTKDPKAVLKSACHAGSNGVEISSPAARVIIPLVNEQLCYDFKGIMTLPCRELILVSFKPSWHADFRTALRILVHGSQNF